MAEKLSKRAYNKIVRIAKKKTEAYRKTLNKNIHVAEISYSAFKNSVKTLTDEEYGVIYAALYNAADKKGTDLKYAISQVKTKAWTGLVFVDDKTYGPFLIAVSYGRLQQKIAPIFKNISVEYSNLSPLLGTDKTGRTVARVGHIASSFSQGKTPLLEKLRDIVKRLPLAAANNITSQLISKLQEAHTFDVEYSFNRNAVGLSNILGSGTVYVTIQSDAKNAELAILENKINAELKKYLTSEEFKYDNLVEPGSNTIIEDIQLLIAHTLDSKKYKKPKKPSTKPKVKGRTTVDTKAKAVPFVVNPPALRDTGTGKFTSLAALQLIINSKITKKIEENMGTGSSQNILNYRSGRFAESVKVEQISQSRQGMLTAYYTYMKNPYATFSAGGRQEKPKSRDPKLLISKSIREIASEHVSNRLRAVLV